jgi:hypothetical protein
MIFDWGGEGMKRILAVLGALLAVAACAPQEPPPPAAAAPAPGYAAASSGVATNYFDGTYTGGFQSATPVATGQCQNYRVAPALTIRNGVAQFAALNVEFQGQVTPQGQLAMQGPGGATFTGQIDPYFVLTGRVTTSNCVYDASWKRYQKLPAAS